METLLNNIVWKNIMIDVKDIEMLDKKWNWGAFLLPPIWGMFNGCPNLLWTILVFPPFNIVVSIIAAIYGNRWSLRGKEWKSKEYFLECQKKWTIAGIIVIILLLCLIFTSEESTTVTDVGSHQKVVCQNITSNGIEFNVKNYGLNIIPPDPYVRDGYYLMLTVSVKNKGKEPYNTNDVEFSLRDSDGAIYGGSKIIDYANPSTIINPGFSKDISLCFEVPSNKIYFLDVSDGSLFETPITFQLKK